MNLYKFHNTPESLDFYEKVSETNPELFFFLYQGVPDELKKREKYIATDAKYAYYYAYYTLEALFPAGEAAIAKDAEYACYYAKNVLKGPFPKGEAAIAKDARFAYKYAKDVLKADFYLDGKLIAGAE